MSGGLKVIITGVTGMVGEGVLFECLENPAVEHVLVVGRKRYEVCPHSPYFKKLEQLIVLDFMRVDAVEDQMRGYDACFFCAGISSLGKTEAEYTHITYNVTMNIAETLVRLNPRMVFCYVSGASTDSTEKGRSMWARVKGRTENALVRLPFLSVYNFRPGAMKPMPGQRNVKGYYKLIAALYPVFHKLLPNYVNTLHELGLAMIRCVTVGYPKQILEVKDIHTLAQGGEPAKAEVSHS